MNLHGIVTPIINAVNPGIIATVRVSIGYDTAANGTQLPKYRDVNNVPLQVQALSYTDIQMLDGLNIQGYRRACYAEGFYAGLIRGLKRGGDLVVFPAGTLPEGDTWKIAIDLEAWPQWVKFAITLQNGS